jgi:hypothetical protein
MGVFSLSGCFKWFEGGIESFERAKKLFDAAALSLGE